MAGNRNLEAFLTLNDQAFQTGLKNASQSVKRFGAEATALGQNAGVAFAALGAAVAASVKAFSDYEAGMANISTVVDTNKESMAAMGQEVLDMAKNTPVAINDLVASLYDIRSAGIDSSMAMETLKASSQLAVAGLSTTAEATDIMTSALNAFKDQGMSAAETANVLFLGVQYGKMTVSQMAEAFGATAPIIHSAGVSLQDFTAATAALTSIGLPASESQNALRAAIVAMKKPTEEMQTVFNQLGVKDGPELIRVSGSMGEAFKRIYEQANASGLALEKVTGRVEGATAITAIATSVNDTYSKTLSEIAVNSGALATAYQKQSETFKATMQVMINNAQALAISIGAELAPILATLARGIQGVLVAFNNLPQPMKQAIAVALAVGTAIAGIVAGAALLVGGIANAVASIMSIVAGLGGWATVCGTVSTALGAVVTVLSGPVGWAIAAAIAASVALYAAWQTNFLGIRDVTAQAVNFIKIVWDDLITGLSARTERAVKNIGALFAHLSYLFNQAVKPMAQTAQNLIAFIQSIAAVAFSKIVDIVNQANKAIISAIKPTIAYINKALASVGLQGLPEPNFQPIKIAVNSAVEYFKFAWDKAGAGAKAAITSNIAAATKELKTMLDNLAKSLAGAGSAGAPSGGGGGGSASGAKPKAGSAETGTQSALKTVTDELTQALKDNNLALGENINKMGALATEGTKLNAQIAKLKEDEKDLLATREKLANLKVDPKVEAEKRQALQDIQNQIRQNAIEQEQLDNQRVRFSIENNRKIADAEAALAQTKAEIQKERLDRAAEHELKSLDTLLNDKKISEEAYYTQMSAIKTEMANREAAIIQSQIDALTTKKAAIEAINMAKTEESIQVEQQIAELEGRMLAVQETLTTTLADAQMALVKPETVEQFNLGIASMLSTFETQLVQGIINGNLKIGDSFKQLGIGLLESFVKGLLEPLNKIIEKAGNAVFNSLIEGIGNMARTTTSATSTATQSAASSVTGFLGGMANQNQNFLSTALRGVSSFSGSSKSIFKTLVDVVGGNFGSMVSFAVSAFRRMFGVAKSANVSAATTKVTEWAVNAAAAVAGIPIIGPALAKAAFTEAMAMGMTAVGVARGVSMAGFAQGAVNIPNDMLAQIHAGEMIIPASFAASIRRGDIALTGGGNGGGSSVQPLVVNLNFEPGSLIGTGDELVDLIHDGLVRKLQITGGSLALARA